MGSMCSKRPLVIEPMFSKNYNNHDNGDNTNNNSNNIPSSAISDGQYKINLKYNIEDNIKMNLVIPNNESKQILKPEINDLKVGSPTVISKMQEFIKGQCIGTGKLGCVYSGLSNITGEIVAIKSIKLIDSQFCIKKQISDVNEAVKKLSQLQHKNIIKYICTQTYETVDEIDIIFEFCSGGSIKQLLDKFGVFDEKLIRMYVKDILEGLVYLHEKNIVHRNITTCNVLVDGNGKVKLTDFVVSNILIGDNSDSILFYNTNNGQDAPFCVAPEIVNKEKNLTWAVDIWSLGCIIIEMATGIPPWANITTNCSEILTLIGNSNAPPKFPSHVSKHLKSFLKSCLQKNPNKRRSAKSLLEHSFFKEKIEQKDIRSPEESKKQPNEILKETKFFPFKSKLSRSFNQEETKLEKDNISLAKKLQPNSNKKVANKILKNGKFNIIEKQNEKLTEEKRQLVENKKSVVNLLATNEENNFFSVSMTVYSQQSLNPQFYDKNFGKEIIDNRILPSDITEVEELDSPVLNSKHKASGQHFDFKVSKLKLDEFDAVEGSNIRTTNINTYDLFSFKNEQTNKLYDENNRKSNMDHNNSSHNKGDANTNLNMNEDEVNESCDYFKNIIENHTFNKFLDFDTIEKLATMELRKEDIQKLETFFKDKNNKISIGPIERDQIEQYILKIK